MNKTSRMLGKSDEDTFEYFCDGLKDHLKTWDYFIDWEKALSNTDAIKTHLDLLSSLIGKADIYAEARALFKKNPSIVKAMPALIAVREASFKVLVDSNDFVYREFDFSHQRADEIAVDKFIEFLKKSKIGELIENGKVTNFVDYVLGIEVGLGSNARKNRGGKLMENIVEEFVADACLKNNAAYIAQANEKRLLTEWGVQIKIDRSSRIIDFALRKDEKLYFIETNFYSGVGSKLKSTASEYNRMNEYWNSQGIEFIWVTDGDGWRHTQRPLREYFDNNGYLINLEMLKNDALGRLLRAPFAPLESIK